MSLSLTTDADCMKRPLQNNRGQALIEFVLFVPFMMILYTSVLTINGAINGSINQQKITRGYFFSRLKNNSYAPTPETLKSLKDAEFSGLLVLGWKERFDNEVPVATCYRLPSFFKSSDTEKCDDKTADGPTRFIRVRTAYGLCGATIRVDNSTPEIDRYSFSEISGNARACTNHRQ